LDGENRPVNLRKLLLLDCDSTLSAIEGVDELARLRGKATFEAVESMTRAAMEGGAAMEEIFSRRLELIQPTVAELETIGALYITHIEPTASEMLREVRAAGWTPIIVSGGFTQAIRPLADHLEITRVEAVTLTFDNSGKYCGFSPDCPTAQSRGKNEVARRLKRELSPLKTVMVGDGASDLEVQGDVDVVIGFGGYAVREKVKNGADAFVTKLAELPAVLQHLN
jgi:phosphoserine phosphatase